jgi:hypothetical protein
MGKTMESIWCRALLPAAAVFVLQLPAQAQQQPPVLAPPMQQVQQNPVCGRLEAQLQAFDRSNNDTGRVEQLRKLEEAAASQQTEIDRQEASARRMGCERNSFFVMLSGQPQQCGPVTTKIKQMKDNLERLQADAEGLRGEPPQEREGQRRTILAALAQNSCGAQYQQAVAAPPPRKPGLFESLFGPRSSPGEQAAPGAEQLPGMPASGSYRTLCVRTCDGFFYPISYATNPGRFADDEKTCRASCPAAEVQLYIHRNPGEGINEAMSVIGQQPYTALPNAFKYRAALDQACSCRRPGESWSQALKSVEDGTVEQGDIVVNEQRARQLSQPRVDAQGRPIRQAPLPASARPAQPTGSTPAPAPAPAATAEKSEDGPSKPDPNRTVRAVGPTFLPAR